MSIKTPDSGVSSPSGKIDLLRYEAAKHWNYRPHEFCEGLSTEWQAELIAAYIVALKRDAVIQQDISGKRKVGSLK